MQISDHGTYAKRFSMTFSIALEIESKILNPAKKALGKDGCLSVTTSALISSLS